MNKKKTMLDLFCGTKSMSNVFKNAGYEVFTVDFDEQHDPDMCVDILEFNVDELPWIPDVIHASPPCTTFSIASCGHHWNKDKTPKTKECEIGLDILYQTINIIEHLGPIYWFIENPRGMMRKQPIMERVAKRNYRHTVTYCQYGDDRMKPTDWWTNNPNWHPKPMCKNGAPCHVSAPRGSKTGTQGVKGSVERSRIPEQLCIEIMESCIFL